MKKKDILEQDVECDCGCHSSDFSYRGGVGCVICGKKHEWKRQEQGLKNDYWVLSKSLGGDYKKKK